MPNSSSRSDLGPRPALGYVDSRLDRAAHHRNDGARLRQHPGARLYAFGGELVALRPATAEGLHDPLLTFAEAAPWCGADAIFLGQALSGADAGAPRFALSFDPGRREEVEARGFVVTDLRSIAAGALVAGDHLGPLATGKALLGWHARHRFCSNCGAPSRVVDGGWRRDCPSCGTQHFPRTDPVAIMLVARGDQCLLGRQSHFAPGMWSCLAGFVEPGETVEDAVRRETLEEAGIRVGRVSYHSCQPWPYPMQLMLGCMAEATSDAITMDAKELEAVRWFSREETAALLTHTHPEGLFAPAPAAIAHHLIRAYVEGAHA